MPSVLPPPCIKEILVKVWSPHTTKTACHNCCRTENSEGPGARDRGVTVYFSSGEGVVDTRTPWFRPTPRRSMKHRSALPPWTLTGASSAVIHEATQPEEGLQGRWLLRGQSSATCLGWHAPKFRFMTPFASLTIQSFNVIIQHWGMFAVDLGIIFGFQLVNHCI